MTLLRFVPVREFQTLQDPVQEVPWAPSVDIFERGDDLLIRAELPGVNREDIEISVETGKLELRGQRQPDAELREGRTHRSERLYGSFTRCFTLPTTVDAQRISASSRNGVLEIVLPKLEQAKPRRIEIEAA